MRTVHVDLGPKSYDIEIEAGLLDTVGKRLRPLTRAETAVIITDSHVGPLYAPRLDKSLARAGFKTVLLVFPAGEGSKNLTVLSTLYAKLVAAGVTRSDVVVTLGGGVTGDMGGFAAASFLRGLDFVQVPTSLLAQIDSSVGGKVAVDLPGGKNLVGAFYQPKAVYIDYDLLGTLPQRFLHDGMAEVIKYGCICDQDLFAMLEGFKTDAQLLAHIDEVIELCCQIKARIVSKDEFDTGARMMLNFGHTLGHGVEKHFHYQTYTHGEAVAIGMSLLTARTEAMGLTVPGTTAQLQRLLTQYHLPLTVDMEPQDFLKAVAMDKKKMGRTLTLIVLRQIGQCLLHKIACADLQAYIAVPAGRG